MLHERMKRILAQLAVSEPQSSAVDYGRVQVSQGEGGHGKHGTTTTPPPAVSSLAIEWAEFFGRALDMAELDLSIVQGRAQLQPRRLGSGGRVANGVANARRGRITSLDVYRGRPDAFVAYVEGCSSDLVRKARVARGLDSHGLPLPKPATSSRLTGQALPHDQEVDTDAPDDRAA